MSLNEDRPHPNTAMIRHTVKTDHLQLHQTPTFHLPSKPCPSRFVTASITKTIKPRSQILSIGLSNRSFCSWVVSHFEPPVHLVRNSGISQIFPLPARHAPFTVPFSPAEWGRPAVGCSSARGIPREFLVWSCGFQPQVRGAQTVSRRRDPKWGGRGRKSTQGAMNAEGQAQTCIRRRL